MGGVTPLERFDGCPILPESVADRLRQIDPALSARPFRFGDNGIEWAVTFRWPEHDPKRARVHSGEIPPESAYDIISFLPLAISVDEIPGYLERGLTAMAVGNSRGYVDEMLARIREENRKAPELRWAKTIDNAMELMDRHATLVSPDIIKVASAGVPNTPDVTPKARQQRAGKRKAAVSHDMSKLL